MRRIGRYFHRVWLGINQFLNTLAGGAPDETISARNGRAGRMGAHGERAVENERRGKTQSEDYAVPTMTRRGALALAAFAPMLVVVRGDEHLRVLDLDAPVVVRHAGQEFRIQADQIFEALRASLSMPLKGSE